MFYIRLNTSRPHRVQGCGAHGCGSAPPGESCLVGARAVDWFRALLLPILIAASLQVGARAVEWFRALAFLWEAGRLCLAISGRKSTNFHAQGKEGSAVYPRTVWEMFKFNWSPAIGASGGLKIGSLGDPIK